MTDFETLKTLLAKDRSVRRFKGDYQIDDATLRQLVGLTTLCASGRNLQPLRYRPVTSAAERDLVYPHLKWAGYYTDWDGPDPDQRPTAYLIQCLDTDLTTALLCDDGLQLQAITLGATALGLSACIIKAFNAPAIKEALNIPEAMQPLYVIALGKADETVKLVDIKPDGDYRYYRDSDDAQCVPKRPLSTLIIK